ncbi:helix-turn-helix domain-containing protein [Marinoscillum sp.]|uniref:helix-turn-helix domain-containing protein n=1 Tax=Marinoscillum sp. TaxID=2024838 RepID=UPI003BA8A9DD
MRHIKTITEYHELAGLPKPEHPLVSLVDYSQVNYPQHMDELSIVNSHYSIALKKGLDGKIRYGQQSYDFSEGLMSFIAPGQVIRVKVHKEPDPHPTGWLLLIHPDFLWGSNLAAEIKQYEFFGYQINEALFLSGKEEQAIIGVMQSIREEYHTNIDAFSQKIIISHIEVLLNYAERFYQRQFITRKIANHQVLTQLETVLRNYFDQDDLASKGLPSVQFVADQLHVSPNYLGTLLKVLTGQNTQQHIHEKLIEKAKEQLSTTQLSVSQIAYTLGFEHSQSFSRLFKSKTNQSPLEFRASFN